MERDNLRGPKTIKVEQVDDTCYLELENGTFVKVSQTGNGMLLGSLMISFTNGEWTHVPRKCNIEVFYEKKETDSMSEMMDNLKKQEAKRWSIESALDQAMWNAQVEADEQDNLFNQIVGTMQQALSDSDLRDKILNIELREIESDEE